jgi:hypothetical protein
MRGRPVGHDDQRNDAGDQRCDAAEQECHVHSIQARDDTRDGVGGSASDPYAGCMGRYGARLRVALQIIVIAFSPGI